MMYRSRIMLSCGMDLIFYHIQGLQAHLWITQSLLWTFIIAVAVDARAMQTSGDFSLGPNCPPQWSGEPIDKCLKNLTLFISRDNAHLSESDRQQQGCNHWRGATFCMQGLIEDCPGKAADIKRRLNAHSNVADNCYTPSSRERENNHICYYSFSEVTNSCKATFDATYNELVEAKNYAQACRTLALIIRCFHRIKTEVSQKCKENGAMQYQAMYIEPIVAQVDNNMRTQCPLNPPFNQYFSSASQSAISSNSSSMLCCSLAAILTNLLLIHWNTWVT